MLPNDAGGAAIGAKQYPHQTRWVVVGKSGQTIPHLGNIAQIFSV